MKFLSLKKIETGIVLEDLSPRLLADIKAKEKMSPPPCYYFINHTRRQFCLFDNEISVFFSVSNALNTNPGWKDTDSISIDCEPAGSTDLVEYLMNGRGYKNMDYHESDVSDDSFE